MSVWEGQAGDTLLLPGTPEIAIRYRRGATTGAESWIVLAAGAEVHATGEGYHAAHLWTQNEYQITSTPMTRVHADYVAARARDYPADAPVAAGPNPYRKQESAE